MRTQITRILCKVLLVVFVASSLLPYLPPSPAPAQAARLQDLIVDAWMPAEVAYNVDPSVLVHS
jgi:hypothetical protein